MNPDSQVSMSDNLKPEYKKLILKAIAYHFPEAQVMLFGSRARGTNRPGADIDLALDIGKPIKLHDMSRIRVTLENLPISLEIDVVDVHNIPDELKAIIARESVIWKD